MKPLRYCPHILLITLLGITHLARAEDILIHAGPLVETPASTPVTPFSERGTPKMIKFLREYFLDRDLLTSLPEPSSEYGTVPVSAIEAIELAKRDIDPQGGLRSWIVTELRLIKTSTSVNRNIEYYFVSSIANGSDYQRVVLMNRKVITSKLRKIEE